MRCANSKGQTHAPVTISARLSDLHSRYRSTMCGCRLFVIAGIVGGVSLSIRIWTQGIISSEIAASVWNILIIRFLSAHQTWDEGGIAMSLSHDQPKTLLPAVIEESNRFYAAWVEEPSWRSVSWGTIFSLDEPRQESSLASEGDLSLPEEQGKMILVQRVRLGGVQKINLESVLIVSQQVGRWYE